jgi:hypothetical protein
MTEEFEGVNMSSKVLKMQEGSQNLLQKSGIFIHDQFTIDPFLRYFTNKL